MQVKKLLKSVAVVSLVALSASVGSAQDAGQNEYMNACAVCHGADGVGGGPLTEFLNVAVPDLTVLAQNNDGKFPMLDIIHIIDGRTGVRGHGGEMPAFAGNMPIWGDRFTAEVGDAAGPYGSELLVRGRILSLAQYLESIQK